MITDRDLVLLIAVVAVALLLLGGYGFDALEWLIDVIADCFGGDSSDD